MKNILKILILTTILVSCQEKTKKEKVTLISNFNLKTDYSDFKHKMTELDTLNIFIDHSVCRSEARERIEITKKLDSLKIKSEYFDATYNANPTWELIYKKTISENDTIWGFEKFLVRNEKRMLSEEKKVSRIIVKHKNDSIQLFTKGLLDLFDLLEDLAITTQKIYPEYLNRIHPISKEIEIVDE